MIVRMWEARCEAGLVEEVLTWARAVGAEALLAGASAAEVYRSEQDRVVLITRWSAGTDWQEPADVPDGVLRADSWPFTPA